MKEEFYRSQPRNRTETGAMLGWLGGHPRYRRASLVHLPATYTMWCVISANDAKHSIGGAKFWFVFFM